MTMVIDKRLCLGKMIEFPNRIIKGICWYIILLRSAHCVGGVALLKWWIDSNGWLLELPSVSRDAAESRGLLHCALGKTNFLGSLFCVELHFSTSPRGSALFPKVRDSSVNLLYSVLWEKWTAFLTYILILHNCQSLHIPLGFLLFRGTAH